MTAVSRINTVVILLDGVIRGNPWVVQAEMEGCKVCNEIIMMLNTALYGNTRLR